MKKRKRKVWEFPYIEYEILDDIPVIYGVKGNPIAIMKMVNPVLESSSDIVAYQAAHNIFLNIIKQLGDGMILQKIDVISHVLFNAEMGTKDVLEDKYLQHFEGRKYKTITTYLAVTESFIRSTKIAKYNKSKLNDFLSKISKILQLLNEQYCQASLLSHKDMDTLMLRYAIFNFDDKTPIVADNILSKDTHLQVGNKYIKTLLVVDTETMSIPSDISTVDIVGGKADSNTAYPVDTMRLLFEADDYDTLVYNQIIEISHQNKITSELKLKQNRSRSIPDPINTLSSEDIDQMFEDVARNNQIIVRAYFGITIGCDSMKKLNKASNWLESSFSSKGFLIGRNSFNQMELFRIGLFGNGNELNTNDMFITSSHSALAFFFYERKQVDESSDFYFHFTDRSGVPIKIDTEDIPMQNGRIANRNKFILGGSGTGKSFLTNTILSQFLYYNTDVVIIDTGHSYKGLCDFYGGRYITYTEEKPISMNPFKIEEDERNLEKYEFLSNLILMIYKDKGSNITQDEYDIVNDLIDAYYFRYFDFKEDWQNHRSMEELKTYLINQGVEDDPYYSPSKNQTFQPLLDKADVSFYYKCLGVESGVKDMAVISKAYRNLSMKHHPDIAGENGEDNTMQNINFAYNIIKSHIEEIKPDDEEHGVLVKRVKDLDNSLTVTSLSFNTFYEFSLVYIPLLLRRTRLKSFKYDSFRYVLKKFYKGGRFETILNEDTDASLLSEKFIVFEIDNVKDNPTLFPIVTLVIMDVFLQKLRLNDKQRKVLVIEEAWKALASDLMRNYMVYLFKTARKFWGEINLVTQDLDDIINNSMVKETIINNSDTIILLDQAKSKDNYSAIAQVLSLSQIEQSKIFTINQLDNKENRSYFKEFYIKRGTSGEVYGCEVSLFQYLTYTTEKPEKNAIEIYKKKYNTYVDAIENFISDLEISKMSMNSFVKVINNKNHTL